MTFIRIIFILTIFCSFKEDISSLKPFFYDLPVDKKYNDVIESIKQSNFTVDTKKEKIYRLKIEKDKLKAPGPDSVIIHLSQKTYFKPKTNKKDADLNYYNVVSYFSSTENARLYYTSIKNKLQENFPKFMKKSTTHELENKDESGKIVGHTFGFFFTDGPIPSISLTGMDNTNLVALSYTTLD